MCVGLGVTLFLGLAGGLLGGLTWVWGVNLSVFVVLACELLVAVWVGLLAGGFGLLDFMVRWFG